MKQVVVHSLTEMNACAKEFVAGLRPQSDAATVFGLSGELGSGKTAFVKGVAQALGVVDHVTSPTFVLQKIYPLSSGPFERLVHVDAYRITDPRELHTIRWNEYAADPKNLLFIEWPEHGAKHVADTSRITFEYVDESTRKVTFPENKT